MLKNLNPLLSTVLANCGSTNTNIRCNGESLLNTLISSTCNYQLVQPFAHLISFGNARVKPLLVSKLAGKGGGVRVGITGNVNETKPQFVEKHILPLFYKLLDDTKMEVRVQVQKLAGALNSALGWEGVVGGAPVAKVGKLRELLMRLD